MDYEEEGVRPKRQTPENLKRSCGKKLSDSTTEQGECCGL